MTNRPKTTRVLLTVAPLSAAAGHGGARAASDGTAPDLTARAAVAGVARIPDRVGAAQPARGDQSPQAGTLRRDRNGSVPTGFPARIVDGFRSQPHIHKATYRAVVISGNIQNDDPDAADMWMPAGSFRTQPQGEVHVTAARWANNPALVEIDQGPYLVRPPKYVRTDGRYDLEV